jgi:hypothetical protein
MSEPRLPLGATGEPPRYFDDTEVGHVLSMVVALAGEVAVMRDRLDTVERLLEGGRPVTREAIDGFLPDERVRADREAWRQQFLTALFRTLHAERERLATAPPTPYDAVVRGAEGD